jgi:hypothetical protein
MPAASASSAIGVSMIFAPAADSRDSAAVKEAATWGSIASSITVPGTARRKPASGKLETDNGLSAMMLSTRMQSSTERVIAQIASSVVDKGRAPVAGTRRAVDLNPTNPHSAAGMRIEPPVSDPNPATHSPAATEAAAPEEEPPGMRASCWSSGLAGVP